MSPELMKYLVSAYGRDVLHESGPVVVPHSTPDLLAEIKAELARINALRLGANLSQRAFVDHQNKRSLEDLLTQLEH